MKKPINTLLEGIANELKGKSYESLKSLLGNISHKEIIDNGKTHKFEIDAKLISNDLLAICIIEVGGKGIFFIGKGKYFGIRPDGKIIEDDSVVF